MAEGAVRGLAPSEMSPHGRVDPVCEDDVEEGRITVVLQGAAPRDGGGFISALLHALITGSPGREPGPEGVLDVLDDRLLDPVLILKVIHSTSHFPA